MNETGHVLNFFTERWLRSYGGGALFVRNSLVSLFAVGPLHAVARWRDESQLSELLLDVP